MRGVFYDSEELYPPSHASPVLALPDPRCHLRVLTAEYAQNAYLDFKQMTLLLGSTAGTLGI